MGALIMGSDPIDLWDLCYQDVRVSNAYAVLVKILVPSRASDVLQPVERALAGLIFHGLRRTHMFGVRTLPEAKKKAAKQAREAGRRAEEMEVNTASLTHIAGWATSRMAKAGSRGSPMRLLAEELKGTSQVKSFSTECFDEASTSAGAETPLLNAKPCVVSFCEAMHKEVLALVTTDSLLLMRATAMQVWEQGLESCTSLWDAWCRMWDKELTFPYSISEGSEVRRTAMLRELQGLFVQRYLHAMARELLSLYGANKKASVDKVALCDERKSDAIQGSKKMGSKKKGSKKAEPPSTPSGLGEQGIYSLVSVGMGTGERQF
eukprot:gene7202-310_t